MPESTNLLESLKENSILGSFLDAAAIASLLERYPVQNFAIGTTIFTERQPASNLVIIVGGKASLATADARRKHIWLGELTSFRAANISSVISGIPHSYALIATEECQALVIPWQELKAQFEAKPYLKNYIDYMKASTTIRSVRNELQEIGCSKEYIVELVGSLEQKDFQPEIWPWREGEAATATVILVEGAVQAYLEIKDQGDHSLWDLPKGTWQFWIDCVDNKPIKYSFRTNSQVRLFALEKQRLDNIRAKYPDDFSKCDDWIRKSISKKEENEGIDARSLEKLFPKLKKATGWRYQYPHVFQNDKMDCGPACLTMISMYYGWKTSIPFWRERVYTNQEGTSLFDLAKAAENNGFVSYSIGVDSPNEIEREHLPCIAARDYHFIVVYKVLKDTVIVGDPAIGIYKLSHKKFMENLEAVLLMRPNKDLTKLPGQRQGYTHYLGLFEGLNKELLFILAASVIYIFFSMFPPFLSQIIVDEVLSKKDVRVLIIILSSATVAVLCQALSAWLRSYYIYFMTVKFDFRSNSSFLKKLFSLSYDFFANHHVGDFTRRLSELERVRGFFTSVLVGSILDMLVLGVYAIVLFWYSPMIALVSFIGAPVAVVIARLFSRALQNRFGAIFNEISKLESLLTDLVKGAGTVKILNAEVGARWMYEAQFTNCLQLRYSYEMLGTGLSIITDSYTQILKFVLMGYAAYLGIKGTFSPGQVIAISMLVGQIVDPFRNLSRNWSAFQEMKTILGRLDDVFLASSETAQQKKGITKPKVRGEIEFQDVWFRYGGESTDWTLRGVSFKVKEGQHIALAGPSGCGKSTIVHLLARLHEPTKGQILIDGRNYLEYDVNWIRDQIGLLQQEPSLFHTTIRGNIGFGQANLDLPRVHAAAKAANAHDFIMAKSNGYQYKINFGGLGLSGGQKQRLAAARMLYKNPSVLLLDEATSMLDGIAESAVLKNLYLEYKDRTILSIAHRYTTALASDFVLVMENGRISGFGTHANLEAEGGLYSELFGLRKRSAA